MKMDEIKELNKEEVEMRLTDATEELYNLRFQHAMHQLDNPIRIREVRKDIARLMTVLHEYQLGVRSDKTTAVSDK